MGKIGERTECIAHVSGAPSPTDMAFSDHLVLQIIKQTEMQLRMVRGFGELRMILHARVSFALSTFPLATSFLLVRL